jgi:pyruvate dehydrogenase E1 component
VLDGAIPVASSGLADRSSSPDTTFNEVTAGSGNQAVSTTMAFTRLVRNLTRDERFGCASSPSSRTKPAFGMDALFRAG